MNLRHLSAPDHLAAYHAFTVEFRRADSDRYRLFAEDDPRTPEGILAAMPRRTFPGDRGSLCVALRQHLSPFSPPAAVMQSIDALESQNTWCIVAGHQPALFGGPLFLFFKIATILRACDILNAHPNLPEGARCVPLFWNASEEHNRAEFGRVSIFDREHDLLHLALPPDGRHRMASRTPAHEADPLIDELSKLLPQTEFLPDLLEDLHACQDDTLGASFTRLLLRWFGERGLIVIEPRMLRTLGASVIHDALCHNSEIHDALSADTREVESLGYRPQLPLHERDRTLVYRIVDDERFRLRASGDGYCLERRDCCYDRDTLLKDIKSRPEEFSPSAALRPILQSRTLPVLSYVAGGGELAYHAQLRGAFSRLNTPMPLLTPRAAGTVIKGNLIKVLDKCGVNPQDIIGPGWEWDSILRQSEDSIERMEEALEHYRTEIGPAMAHLQESLQNAGAGHLGPVEAEAARYLDRLEAAVQRLIRQHPGAGESAKRQYFRLRKFLLPGDGYQELSCWSLYFLALYGKDWLPALIDATDPFTSDHQIFITE